MFGEVERTGDGVPPVDPAREIPTELPRKQPDTPEEHPNQEEDDQVDISEEGREQTEGLPSVPKIEKDEPPTPGTNLDIKI